MRAHVAERLERKMRGLCRQMPPRRRSLRKVTPLAVRAFPETCAATERSLKKVLRRDLRTCRSGVWRRSAGLTDTNVIVLRIVLSKRKLVHLQESNVLQSIQCYEVEGKRASQQQAVLLGGSCWMQGIFGGI